MGGFSAKKVIPAAVIFAPSRTACLGRGFVAITKVAAYFRSDGERPSGEFPYTREADLVAATMFLSSQVPASVRFSYITQLYLPFFFVHALPGRSLLVSGIGNPKVTVRHSSVPSLAEIRAQLRGIEELEQIPSLLADVARRFETPPGELIEIRNTMLPMMIETFNQLMEPSLPEPAEETCIVSSLSTKELHDVGILFRTERARLDNNLSQIAQAETLFDEFFTEQKRILDARKDRLSRAASLNWEEPTARLPSSEQAPVRTDESTQQLEAEKQRISLGLSNRIGSIEQTLSFSADQCRRLLVRIRANPSETERILAELKPRVGQLQTTATEFISVLQQLMTEIQNAAAQLEAAERRWLWSRRQPPTQWASSEPTRRFAADAPDYSAGRVRSETAAAQLQELAALQEAMTTRYDKLQRAMSALKTLLQQQYARFENISASADALQGYLPLMQFLVPVFVIKTGDEVGQYAMIPPLRLTSISSTPYNVEVYDEVLGDQLQQLVRTEIRTNAAFRVRLDQQALATSWINRANSIDHFYRGAQQLMDSYLLSTQGAEQLINYWLNIVQP
jgi:hypothetical protein